MEGALDPAIDAEQLFRVSIAGSANLLAQRVVQLVSDDQLYQDAQYDPSLLQPLSESEADLALQQASFLRLPEARQSELIAQHRERSDAARAALTEEERQRSEIASLREELRGLQEFLEGNRTSLARLDLDLRAFVAADGNDETEEPSQYPAEAPYDTRIAWLQAAIAREKARVLALPPARLAELVRASGLSTIGTDEIATADAALQEAQSDLRNAEQEAALARDEQTRMLANENTLLLETRQSQAEVRAELARMNAELPEIQDRMVAWQQRVEQLRLEGAGTQAADRAYDELVRDLAQTRQTFRTALSLSENIEEERIYPAPIDALLAIPRPEVAGLAERYDELTQAADDIREDRSDAVWSRRTLLHEVVAQLNDTRLELIPSLTAAKRAQVTGFGTEGVAQASREVDQIVLQFRYYLKSWPRLVQEGVNFTPRLVFELGWIVLATILFRFWRRRGDAIIASSSSAALARRPKDVSSAIRARMLYLWRKVKKPLDWSIFLLILRWLWPPDYYFPGIGVVWLVAFWTACTLFLMTLVDELARGASRTDPRAQLRWKSLRLIGGTFLAVALLLEISESMVGKGAIHSWVASFAWILLPVLIVLLTLWWQERIKALSTLEAERSSFLAWVSGRPTGAATLIPYAIAGIILLATGLRSVIARQVSRIALVREFGRQRAHDEAARQVAEDKASGRYRSLPEDVADQLHPHRKPKNDPNQRVWPGALPRPRIRPGTITAIIGDRGSGKSTLMRDTAALADRFDSAIHLSVDDRGIDGVIADLSEGLGIGDHENLADDLQGVLEAADQQLLITVDDIHRLIVPAIHGLDQFDTLAELARKSSTRVAWMFSIERVSWDFLQRARLENLVFDEVLHMPAWSLEDIRDLVERRTTRAGLNPDFETILDAGVFGIGGDLSPIERKKLSYFQRLHDYSEGNPAVALEFWRRSLFLVEDTDKVAVLTFAIPPSERLSSLPLPALIVLRSLLQMGRADAAAVEHSTDLPTQTVAGALRRLQRIGAVQFASDRYLVTLEWWLEACRLLERRNLLIRRAK